MSLLSATTNHVQLGQQGWLTTFRLGYALCCVLTIGLVGCEAAKQTASPKSKPDSPPFEAEILQVQKQSWPTIVRSQGSLYADEQSVVGAKVAGRVARVHVDLGDLVQAGDPLVTLDQEDFSLQVEQAEAQLEQARSAVGLKPGDPVEKLDPENAPPVRQERAYWNESKSSLERAANLLSQSAISLGEYDQLAAAERVAEARYASSLNSVREKIALIGVQQAELSLARQRLQEAVIRAPLDGFVQQRHVAVGTYLNVGQPIATVVRTHPLRFRGTVPERYAQAIAVGQQVKLSIESVPQPRTALITRVSPSLDQLNRSLAFEVQIDNQDHRLRTGLFVDADVVIDESAVALVVPASAISEFAGTEKVWKVVDGMANDQEVLTGAQRGEYREILRGLELGDEVLLKAARGRMARVIPKTTTAEPLDLPVVETASQDAELAQPVISATAGTSR